MKKIPFLLVGSLFAATLPLYALEATGTLNLNSTANSSLNMTFPCNPSSVTHGTVNPNTCAITCEGWYSLSNNACIVSSSGGGGGGGGGGGWRRTVSQSSQDDTTWGTTRYPVLLASSSTSLFFTDISNSFARADIESFAMRGIVVWYPDGSFKPNNPITRAEFLAVTMKALGVSVTGVSTTPFRDIPTGEGAWILAYAEKARQMGIVYGQTIDGVLKFRPNDPITRAESVIILLNAAKISLDTTLKTTTFQDVGLLLIPYVESARKLGIVSGQVIDGVLKFRPNDPITRAESVRVIMQASLL